MARSGSLGRTGRRPWRAKLLLAGLVVALVAWAQGFLSFVAALPTAPDAPDQRTDAIVVLTGGSLRLEEGLALLQSGMGAKLFVSGVYQGVEVRELLRHFAASPEDVACCIALGYAADDTVGNARETAAWMREQGYASLRLVTAGYHMPRALVEFHAAMPEVTILAHPVLPDQVKTQAWWRYPGTAGLLAEEYTKTQVARLANTLLRLIGREG